MRTIIYLLAAFFLVTVSACGNRSNRSDEKSDKAGASDIGKTFKKGLPADTLLKRLIRAGELEVSGLNKAEVHTYFDTTNFRFHGPDARELNYTQLTGYFESLRAAFDDLTIRRGLIIKEGNYIACQTYIEGKFVRKFTQSPIGPLLPNGKHVVFDFMNIFRFDDQGRLVEEWIQRDNRSILKQLGAGEK
jgi:predicted ester cyclase